jgi:hypothetical protein
MMLSIGGKQIDHAYAVFVPLWEVQLIVCVVIDQAFEKGTTANGLVLSVHLSRLA